jgi:hypothetical protein
MPIPRVAAAAAFAVLTLLRPQDPVPVPPAPAATPGQTPARARLEGVYQLRARIVDGKKITAPSQGWLAITRRHLFVCLSAPGADPDAPLLRAGVRAWQADGEAVRTTVRLGWFTDRDGEVHVERAGTEERRRIEPIQGGVRVVQDERNFLEFERVE